MRQAAVIVATAPGRLILHAMLCAALLVGSVGVGVRRAGGAHADAAVTAVTKVLPDRMRGANISVGESTAADPTAEDFLDTIPRWASWNINVLRIQLLTDNNGESEGVPPTASDPLAPYQANLVYLDKVIAVAGRYGLKIIINPILYGSLGANYWQSDPVDGMLRNDAVLIWKALAARYKDNPTVVGYDLFNEPAPAQGQYDEYNKQLVPEMICAVRSAPDSGQDCAAATGGSSGAGGAGDASTYLVLEPISYADFQPNSTYPTNPPSALPIITDTAGMPDPRVIYSLHWYWPQSFTTQNNTFATKYSHYYPGQNYDCPTCSAADVSYWDKGTLAARMQSARGFQLAAERAYPGSHIRMYVGEFGAVRYVPNPPDIGRWAADLISLFEGYGWDWTVHSLANYNGYNPTFTSTDGDTGAPYGDVMMPELQSLLAGWALNPTSPYSGTARLPYPVGNDQPYDTDFSGAGGPPSAGPPTTPPLPPGWAYPSGQSQASSSGITNDVLIHMLSAAAPSTNPSAIAYGRQTYAFSATAPLYAQADLNPGATPGSASHLRIANGGGDKVDLFERQDGTLGYEVTDGGYDSGVLTSTVGASAAPTATVRFDVTPGGVTFYRNGLVAGTIAHDFAHTTGYSLELEGTSTRTASLSGSPILIYAGDVAIGHAPGGLSSPGAGGASSPTPTTTHAANPTATATDTAHLTVTTTPTASATPTTTGTANPTARATATGRAGAAPPTAAPTGATSAPPAPTATATATAVPSISMATATVASSVSTGTIVPTATVRTRVAGSSGGTPTATRASGAGSGGTPGVGGHGGRARLSGCAPDRTRGRAAGKAGQRRHCHGPWAHPRA